MFNFNLFPYTDFNKVNLDWIMRKLKEQISGLVASVNGMTGDVTLTAADVGAMPDGIVPIVKGGTNANDVYAARNNFGVSQGVDNDETRAAYKRDIADTVVSYISEFYNNKCLVGEPKLTGGIRVVTRYNETNGYTQLLTLHPERFNYTDIATVFSSNPHIFYSDCTTFASLLLKCKRYVDSPYYLGFSNSAIDIDTLKNAALDNEVHKTYTVDALNHWIGMGTNLMNSGSKATVLYHATEMESATNYDALDILETGDVILFAANADGFAGNSLYIHHIGVFIKTLDELNNSSELGVGQSIRAINLNGESVTSNRGYVIHCAGGLNSSYYDSGIRIQTIEDMMLYDSARLGVTATEITVYAARPQQNISNSYKCFKRVTGVGVFYDYLDFNGIKMNTRLGGFVPDVSEVAGNGLTATITKIGNVVDVNMSGTLTESVAPHAAAVSGLPHPSDTVVCVGSGGYVWEINTDGEICPYASTQASGSVREMHTTYISE